LEIHTWSTLELHVDTGNGPVDGDRSLLAARFSVTLCLVECCSKCRRVSATAVWCWYFGWRDLTRIRLVRLSLWSCWNEKMSPIARCRHFFSTAASSTLSRSTHAKCVHEIGSAYQSPMRQNRVLGCMLTGTCQFPMAK